MKALIFDSRVVQIEVAEFPVAAALEWVDITGITPAPKVGWVYDGAIFTAPPPPPPPPPKSAADVSVRELITQMIKDGTMTQAKINAIKTAR